MRKLILIRHGETAKNADGKMHITGDPEKLTSHGREQLHKTAGNLKQFLPFKLYSSKEARALESAQIIAKELKVNNNSLVGLQERNWGDYSDKPWLEIKAILDPMNLEERFTYMPPNGESWQEFEARLAKAIKTSISKSNDNIVIVTHGGAIRALIPYLLKIPKDQSFKYDPDNASISVFDFDENKFSEVLINDTTHLVL